MAQYKVVEIFESINGEGMKAGELAVFVRMQGCNLRCNYCDTMWANEKDASFRMMTEDEIYSHIKSTGIRNVTLTGGEPLLQKGIVDLINRILQDDALSLEIETNGSVSVKELIDDIYNRDNLSFTFDYKMPGSGMEKCMNTENYDYIGQNDTIKMVVSDEADMTRAKELIRDYELTSKCNVIFSPVFGRIEPQQMVEFVKNNCLNGVRIQLQLHKIIWDPDKKGV